MLAYLFWHKPGEDVATDTYESALERFHRSLAASPPVGFLSSSCYRAAELPWLSAGGPGYEDWYLVEDYTALGVLGEAAVGAGHLSAHDHAARRSADGTAGLYRLCEGEAPAARAMLSIWVSVARRTARESVEALLLADGAVSEGTELWRRELVLGPAPEYCLLTAAPVAGVLPARLPTGWTASTYDREALWLG